jgi:hypothetical protein
LNTWHATYGPQGLVIIGVSQQTSLGPLGDTVAELGITYAVAEDSDRDTWDAYGMVVYPSWAFIDADGSLAHRQAGVATSDATLALIEQALGP